MSVCAGEAGAFTQRWLHDGISSGPRADEAHGETGGDRLAGVNLVHLKDHRVLRLSFPFNFLLVLLLYLHTV